MTSVQMDRGPWGEEAAELDGGAVELEGRNVCMVVVVVVGGVRKGGGRGVAELVGWLAGWVRGLVG